MYKQIFTPTEQNNVLPFLVPREWYGQPVAFVVFPVHQQRVKDNEEWVFEQITDKNFVSLSASSLSKDWDSPEDEIWDDLLAQMPSI